MTFDIFGENIWSTIPPLYSQDKVEDPMVYAKLLSPGNDWVCYVIEGERSHDRLIIYALFIGGGVSQRGQIEIEELQRMAQKNQASLLVDKNFAPTRLSLLIGTRHQECHAM
jgi:hypothetical protein